MCRIESRVNKNGQLDIALKKLKSVLTGIKRRLLTVTRICHCCLKIQMKQECIPVGRVPSAEVATGGVGVCPGGCLPQCMLGCTPPCEQNDRCLWKHNLAATTLRTVINTSTNISFTINNRLEQTRVSRVVLNVHHNGSPQWSCLDRETDYDEQISLHQYHWLQKTWSQLGPLHKE